MDPMQSGGWCAPSDIVKDLWISDLLKMSDEDLAAYAETHRGGGPCTTCGGTGFEHQPCGCPYCEGQRDKLCWECDGSGVEPDQSSWYTREALERFQAELANAPVFDLPDFSVRRGGIDVQLIDAHRRLIAERLSDEFLPEGYRLEVADE